MPVYVGTSGWQYKDWAETFYPPGLSDALKTQYLQGFRVQIAADWRRFSGLFAPPVHPYLVGCRATKLQAL